jgi:hypothetical protein
MCWPHPAHVGLAQLGQVTREHMVVILPCFLRWFSSVVFFGGFLRWFSDVVFFGGFLTWFSSVLA